MISNDDPYLTGQLLIAMPGMEDERFLQSVILLCAHTDEGAMGIVLNRPLAKPSFESLLSQLDVEPTPPAREIRLCQGGPVDHGRGFVLHTNDWTGDGSLRVDDNLAFDRQPRRPARNRQRPRPERGPPCPRLRQLGPRPARPGDAGQTSGSSTPAPVELLFDADYDTKWRQRPRILRIDPLLLSAAAGHA